MSLEGSSDPVWNTDTMRDCRDKWSLADDVQLLKYLERFSQSIITKANCTLKSMDSFENAVNCTCIEVKTVSNMFQALADTQFVENRVNDEDENSSPPNNVQEQIFTKSTLQTENSMNQNQMKDMLLKCLHTLDTKFETVELSSSESDGEDESTSFSQLILKPINRYRDRPLPHLIGSEQFMNDDTLGLDPYSEEESENEEDVTDISSSSSGSFKKEHTKIEQEPNAVEGSLAQQLSAKLSFMQKPGSSVMSEVQSGNIGEINYKPESAVNEIHERTDRSTPTTLNSSVSTLAEVTHFEAQHNMEIEHDLFEESPPNSPFMKKVLKSGPNIFGENVDLFNENSGLKSKTMKRNSFDDEVSQKSETIEDDLFRVEKKREVQKESSSTYNLFSDGNDWNSLSPGPDPDPLFQGKSTLFGSNSLSKKEFVKNDGNPSESKTKDIFRINNPPLYEKNVPKSNDNTKPVIQSQEPRNSIKHFPTSENKSVEVNTRSDIFDFDGDLFDDNSNLFVDSKLPTISKDNSLFFEDDDNEFDDLFCPNVSSNNRNLNAVSKGKNSPSDGISVRKKELSSSENTNEYFCTNIIQKLTAPSFSKSVIQSNVQSGTSESMKITDQLGGKDCEKNEVKHTTGVNNVILNQANISTKLNSQSKNERISDLNIVTDRYNSNNWMKKPNASVGVEKANANSFSEPHDGLPPMLTSTLHCVAKSRVRIQTKRRLPTRKRRNTTKPQSPNAKLKSAIVLSPSTDEEDLFVIPASNLPKEKSSNDLFAGSVLLSPGVSIDKDNLSNNAPKEENSNVNSFSSFGYNSPFGSTSMLENILPQSQQGLLKNKENKNIFNDLNDEDIFSSHAPAQGWSVSKHSTLQKDKMFDEFEDDLFKVSPKTEKRTLLIAGNLTSSNNNSLSKTENPKDIFDQSKVLGSKKGSLFDDLSEDDDIFSGVSNIGPPLKIVHKPVDHIIDDNYLNQPKNSHTTIQSTKTTKLLKKEVFHDPLMSSAEDFSSEQ